MTVNTGEPLYNGYLGNRRKPGWGGGGVLPYMGFHLN